MKYAPLIALALVIAAARFFVPSQPFSPAGTYKALSHIFVGGLYGAWLNSCANAWALGYGFDPIPDKVWRWLTSGDAKLFWIATALTSIEVLAFFSRPR